MKFHMACATTLGNYMVKQIDYRCCSYVCPSCQYGYHVVATSFICLPLVSSGHNGFHVVVVCCSRGGVVWQCCVNRGCIWEQSLVTILDNNFMCCLRCSTSLSGENRRLVIDELVEVGDFRRITDHFRGNYRRIYLN
jgi:hypothetical protein